MDQVSYKWRIRFITMRYLLIILCYVSFIIAQDFIPQNNVSLSYTQIFFKWPQINNTSSYKLYFNNQESEYESNQNSIVIDAFEWNNNYSWYVCGINESNDIIACHDEMNFNIRPLPDDYPANVNILEFNESEYLEGVTLLDYESLGF